MKHTYLFFVIVLFFSTSVFGQKVLKTNSGQRILLVDDGSWRLLSPIENIGAETSAGEGTSLNSFKPPQQGKYPLNSDQRLEIQNLLTNFLSDEAQLMVNMEMNKRKIDSFKDQKKGATNDKDKFEKIQSKIESAKLDLEKDEVNYNSVSKLIKLSNELLAGEIKNTEKALATIQSEFNSNDAFTTGMGGVASEDRNVVNNEIVKSDKGQKLNYPIFFSVEKGSDLRGKRECEIVFDGYDEEIGEDRKEVKTQPFFSYSQEKMKPYFKTEDFLTCDANIAKIGKKYFLTLKIRIRSKDATKTYGSLPSDQNLVIELINGRKIYSRNLTSDKGEIETYTGHTKYAGIFELKNDDIKDLKKHYLDNLAIIWSSGYEKYDIFNVDFIKNQLECLTK